MEQLRADILDVVAKLPMREPVGSEAIDNAERVAKFVVEPRADDARGQGVAHVADALAHVIPDVRDFPGTRVVFEIDEDRGHPRAREATQEVKLWRFLQRAFKALRD